MELRNTVGILQPGYIPWLGFFEQMSRCDTFVFLDDVKYTERDWRNRNRIKTPDGVLWLTVPVVTKGLDGQKINEARIEKSKKWQLKHLKTIETFYRKANHFEVYFEELKHFFKRDYEFLCPFVVDLTFWITEKLGLDRKTVMSSELNVGCESKQDRLVNILKALDSNHFYEGKMGKGYIDTGLFVANGITVEFQDYDHPFYNQLWQEKLGYVSHLSILDLLFNHGPESLNILTGKISIRNENGTSVRHADEFRCSG
jgi:WbqC-like protein family